ncbi:MAG: DarT ssDNA thymidine ADP-ribosyltransferase family protein [Chlorobium sp.]
MQYFFADGHVRSFTSTSYNDDKYLELLDWEAINAKYWKSDENDLRRQEKKQAELLVKDCLPLNAIELFCVYNEKAQQVMYSYMVEAKQRFDVKISPHKLYYDHL